MDKEKLIDLLAIEVNDDRKDFLSSCLEQPRAIAYMIGLILGTETVSAIVKSVYENNQFDHVVNDKFYKEKATIIFNEIKNGWGYAGLEYDEQEEINSIADELKTNKGCAQLLENEIYGADLTDDQEYILHSLVEILSGKENE